MKRYILAITGATGVAIGLRVLQCLAQSSSEVHLIVSNSAIPILKEETGIDLSEKAQDVIKERFGNNILVYGDGDLWSPLSSGSFITSGMFIVPCTMKTLSAVANGYADGLIERAADVTIKEGRPLILSPRETPLNTIHIENMLKLAKIGVRIVPPVVGFYHKPRSVEDIVDFIAGKILDQAGIDHDLYKRWSPAV